MNENAKRLAQAIEEASSVMVASHVNPDGDTFGTALGLALTLRELGKDVDVYNRDECPWNLNFLPGVDTLINHIPDKEYDLALICDCGHAERVSKDFAANIRARRTAIIDHHDTSPVTCDIDVVDVKAPAAGIVAYELLREAGIPIGKDAATCFFTAITTDTGWFRYANTDAASLRTAADLVALGVDAWEVSQAVNEQESDERYGLLHRALASINRPIPAIATMLLTSADFEETGASIDMTEGIVDYARALSGVEVGLLVRCEGVNKPGWKVSLRSRGKVDVAAIAKDFGGGGHHAAAGANLGDGDPRELTDKLTAAISRALSAEPV